MKRPSRLSMMLAILGMLGGLFAVAVPSPAQAQQTAGVSITNPSDGARLNPGPLTIRGTATGATDQASVVFVVDVSGSTSSPRNLDCNGDGATNAADNINGDSADGDVLDCELFGVRSLTNSLQANAGAGLNLQAGLVVFGSSAAAADMSSAGGQQNFGPVPGQLNQVLASVDQGGVDQFTPFSVSTTTDFDDAIDAALAALQGRPGQREIHMLTDGSSGVRQATLDAIAASGVTVRTYSVGNGADGCDPTDEIREISDAGNGTCTEVLDPSQLSANITGGGSSIGGLTLTLDGVVVPTTLTGGTWQADVVNPAVGTHTAVATVRLLDGTEVTDTVTFEVIDNTPPPTPPPATPPPATPPPATPPPATPPPATPPPATPPPATPPPATPPPADGPKTGQPAPVQWVVHTTSYAHGWVIMDGAKQWLDATCRTRIEATGTTFALTTYEDFGNLGVSANPLDCDQLTSRATRRLVTNGPNNDAGWVLQGGNRMWTPPACRAALEAQGGTFTVIPFDEITTYPLVSGPCDAS